MRRNLSRFCFLCGILCLFGAYSLSMHNHQLNQTGLEHCENVVTQFQEMVAEPVPYSESVAILPEDPTPLRNEGIYIDGSLYIGVMEIPSLSLTLPVHMDLSLPKLETAPCVYLGHLDQDNLVVAGHNYGSHFGNLYRLGAGAEISITNPNGQTYRYQVAEVSTIHQSEVARLMDRDKWDLTLFTCDYPNHTQRIMVRALRMY